MIYIFKGCQNACKGCSKGCDKACKACGECCEPCAKVLERPLGWYVFFDTFMNLLMVVFAVLGIIDPKIDDCEDPVKVFLIVDCVLAVINVWFSFHMQWKLIEGLSDVDAAQITAKELLKRAGHIMCYDIGFCLYVFAFIFCLAWNSIGLGWTGDCKTEEGWPGLSALMGVLFCVLSLWILAFWYLMLCCEDCCCPTSKKKGGGYMVNAIMGNPKAYRHQGGHPQPPQPPQQAQMYGQPTGMYPAQQMQAQPVQGQPVAATPYQQQPAPSAPPKADTKSGTAAQVVGAGLQGVGGMMQGLGQKLTGKGKKDPSMAKE